MLEMENKELENAIERFIHRDDTAKKRNNGLEVKSIEIIQTNTKRKTSEKWNRIEDLWDNMKQCNMDGSEIPEGEERENRAEAVFVGMVAQSF